MRSTRLFKTSVSVYSFYLINLTCWDNIDKSHVLLTLRAGGTVAVEPVTIVTVAVVGSSHVDATLLTVVGVRCTLVYV